MPEKTLAVAVVTGCAFILLGLSPGLEDDLRRFQDAFMPFRRKVYRLVGDVERPRLIPGQRWFAVCGGLVILLGLFGYFFG